MPQARDGDPSAYVVVLVHGTWAPGAAWTRSGSVLRRELEVHLTAGGASTVRFVDDFRWSGANSHEARRSAAAYLNRRLHGVLRDFPGAQIFVVAHSHGGNLALRAIGLSKRLRDGIAGVVCISTPFLLFAPRRAILATLVGAYEETIGYLGELVGRYFLHGLIAAAVGVMATPFYVLWVKFGPSALTQSWVCLPLDQPACSPVVAWSIGAVLAVVVWSYSAALWKEGWNRAKRSLGPLFVHEGNRILRRYGYVQPRRMVAGLRVLSLSSAFDEALTALTGAWWVHMTSGALIRAAMTLSAATAGMLMGAVLFFVFAGLESLRSHPWVFPIAEKAAVIPILLSGIGLLLLLRWTARILVPIAARSSFGASLPDPAKNLILSVHARREVTAMYAWESSRFGLLMLLYTSKGMLFHSLIYNCPPALAHVGSWMLRMAAVRRAPEAAS